MHIEDILKKEKFEKLDEFLDAKMKTVAGEELYESILQCFSTRAKATEWFYTKTSVLNNNRPYDYCISGKKEQIAKDVKDELLKIKYGKFYMDS